MSRSHLPPIRPRSGSTSGSDLSGQITVDQFLTKYARISANQPSPPVPPARLHSPSSSSRLGLSATLGGGTSMRRTSIHRQLGSASYRSDGSASPRPTSDSARSTVPFRRSEQALMMTEHSSVLIPALDSPSQGRASESEYLSTGDYSSLPSDWRGAAKFQQSPSPDNRYGDKELPRERKSLFERWEESQEVRRRVDDWKEAYPSSRSRSPVPFTSGTFVNRAHTLSTGRSSENSPFDDETFTYHRPADTRGSSQETGFEPNPLEEAALRPHSGVDSLCSPRRRPRTQSSSGTEPSSACSELSTPLPPRSTTSSIFHTEHADYIDEKVQAMWSAKPPLLTPPTPRTPVSPEPCNSEPADWDQADLDSRPVLEKPHFLEPIRLPTTNTQIECERYGMAKLAKRTTSQTKVLEKLSQIVSTHRKHVATVQPTRDTNDTDTTSEATKDIEPTPKLSAGRIKGAVPSPRPLGAIRMPLISVPIRRKSDLSGLSPRLLGERTAQLGREKYMGRRVSPFLTADKPSSTSSLPLAVLRREPPTPEPVSMEPESVPKSSPAVSNASISSLEMSPCSEDVSAPAAASDTQSPAEEEIQRSDLSSPQPFIPTVASLSSEMIPETPEQSHGTEPRPAEVKTSSGDAKQLVRLDVYPAQADEKRLSECGDDPVDVTMTQLLVWRQVLKWTAVSSTVLTVLALLILLVVMLL